MTNSDLARKAHEALKGLIILCENQMSTGPSGFYTQAEAVHAAIDDLAASREQGHAQNCGCHSKHGPEVEPLRLGGFLSSYQCYGCNGYRDPRCSPAPLSDNVRPNADASPSPARASGHPAGGGTNPAAPLPSSAEKDK